MQKLKVTAVILNYNSCRECKRCLGFLQEQDYGELSVIVVDNASTMPKERQALHAVCKKVGAKLLLNNKNIGFSAGNNVGIRAAVQSGADWILVLNPDVELRDPHYISGVMERLPGWPKAAVAGTNVLLPGGVRQNPMRELTVLEEICWPMEILKQKLGIWDGYRSEDKTGYCEKVSGCCFFISRNFLEKSDYLDEAVFLYCEEPILAKRVRRAGFKILYIKEITAHHEHDSAAKKEHSKSGMRQFFHSRLYYIDQYSGYGQIGKKFAALSRKVQMMVWSYRK